MTTSHIPQAKNGAITRVASTTGSVTVMASNPERKGALLYNESTSICYLLLAKGTASATNYSLQVAVGGMFKLDRADYSGEINASWVTANGFMQGTEFTV